MYNVLCTVMILFTIGIVSNEDDSLFFYVDDEDWATFYRPQYSPLFGPVFASSELEETARKLCKNDTFCLYDIAATGRVEIGMTTLKGSEDFENLIELSAPGKLFLTLQCALVFYSQFCVMCMYQIKFLFYTSAALFYSCV